jgi:hypothetical protein
MSQSSSMLEGWLLLTILGIEHLEYQLIHAKIEPIRQESRENMFYKGNIEKIKWG